MASDSRQKRQQLGVGFWIWWRRSDGSRGGPAQVWLLVLSGRRRWAYVELDGNGVWVREDAVTEVVRGSGRPQHNDPLKGQP